MSEGSSNPIQSGDEAAAIGTTPGLTFVIERMDHGRRDSTEAPLSSSRYQSQMDRKPPVWSALVNTSSRERPAVEFRVVKVEARNDCTKAVSQFPDDPPADRTGAAPWSGMRTERDGEERGGAQRIGIDPRLGLGRSMRDRI
jgi:hypothetical protein